MGRVTTDIVVSEVKLEHSGSKKPELNYSSVQASKEAIMTDRKAVIKNADMSEDMQQDAVDCATQAMEKYNIEKDIAAYIKKEFDKKYNPTWHCIVGRNFGSYVTHETKHFIYFYLGQVAILLFKSG
ncbi:dynein, light chain, LC8-type 2b [Ctenopharyngodon idella]|uniref:dynein, light chain, LC8-type 2b n=1 Tax=Ctenopharyngodon idella TaxID=7959 RepID=UPI00222E2D22|nr:dynein, light chain, LC8-type 2b [Ctenopharyngodon idella]